MRGANKREERGTAEHAHNQNVLHQSRAGERASESTQQRKENIRDPAHDSQAGSREAVSAIKEIQSAAQRHRQP